MQALTTYLPMDRRQALAIGQTLPDRTRGAVLFADISGFTPLATVLFAELGAQQGAEEMTRQLNHVFNELIIDVHKYGGSIISFSGDAITCWFVDDDGSRATACALTMQQSMKRLARVVAPSGTAFLLAVKIAVATGAARRFVVGQPEIQSIDVLAGEILDRVAAAESQLRAGEVVVGPEVMGQLGNRAKVKEWRASPAGEHFAVVTTLIEPVAPAPWPAVPPLNLELARSWLLPAVFARLQRGEGEFLAELRIAVPMFVSFTGIDYDRDDEAGRKLHAFVCWVQDQLNHYGGTLIELTMGDKGSHFYAVFGAPLAYEDNVTRAVAAALRIRNLPDHFQSFIHNIRIGISQGQLRVGAYGGHVRRGYGAQGREVNIAAQLMLHAAPGQILVTPHVADQLSATHLLTAVAPVTIKGSTEPLALHAVEQKRAIYHTSAATIGSLTSGSQAHKAALSMIGRAAEQRLLNAHLQRLRGSTNADSAVINSHVVATSNLPEPRGGCIVIEGEAGIGKSYLANNLIAQASTLSIAQPTAIKILRGAGDSVENATPYFAWRPIFRQLLTAHVENGLAQPEAIRALASLPAAEHLLPRAPLLNAVLSVEVPDNELTAQMTGDIRADNTREFLLDVLASATYATPDAMSDVMSDAMSDAVTTESQPAPTLLVLEDVHWLDSASWALLDQVRRLLPHILLLLVTRPIAVDPTRIDHNTVAHTAADQSATDEHVPEEWLALAADPQTVRIALTPLTRDETYALVCRRLQVVSVPPALIDFIYQQAEGHPFYTDEMTRALRSSELIEVLGDRCLFTADIGTLRAHNFLSTLEGVVGSRIDQLAPAQQMTLKVASVIGRTFPVTALHGVHPIEADHPHLLAYLQNLTQMDITSVAEAMPEMAYLFKHIITQEVVYGRLLFAQRQQLHRAVAEWLEANYADDLPSFYALLAYHWRQAAGERPVEMHLVEKALHYLDKAGEQAMHSGAYWEVVSFLSQAIDLVPALWPQILATDQEQQLRHARWHRLLGEAYYGLGKPQDSRRYLHRAAELLGLSMPTTRQRIDCGPV